MTRTITALAASLTACALCATAHAAPMEASASISVTGLTFELIDLDLADGIAPSLQYVDGGSMTKHWTASAGAGKWNSLEPDDIASSDVQSALSDGSHWFAPVQAGVSNPAGQSSVVMTPSSITVSASTMLDTVTVGEQTNGVRASLEASAYDSLPFISYMVTPNTAVRVTGQYELGSRFLTQDPQTYGSASTYFLLAMVSDTWSQAVEDSTNSDQASPEGSRSGSFDLLMSNLTADRQEHTFFLNATAYANLGSSVSDVPEPTSIALMLAGLGVALVAARQRQAKVG